MVITQSWISWDRYYDRVRCKGLIFLNALYGKWYTNQAKNIYCHTDLASRSKDGRGWVGGLSKKDQPRWVKEQEIYDTFENFFRTKVLGEDRRSKDVD